MRAQRRHDAARVADKRRKQAESKGFFVHPSMLDTGSVCSCYMCGNPRKHESPKFQRTLAERRSFITFAESVGTY